MTKERPILFSGAMVRAILDGRKTQTRRVVKPKRGLPIDFVGGGPVGGPDWNDPACWGFEDLNTAIWWLLKSDGDGSEQIPCPHGQPGDRLWVRENGWERPERTARMLREGADTWAPYYYDADSWSEQDILDFKAWGLKRRPSIHMPRTACRLVLEITGVRVERLNDCSEEDALAEGVTLEPCHPRHGERMGRDAYQKLWDSINGAGVWKANPWVWVVEFRRAVSQGKSLPCSAATSWPSSSEALATNHSQQPSSPAPVSPDCAAVLKPPLPDPSPSASDSMP